MRLISKLMLMPVVSLFLMVPILYGAPAYVTGNASACSATSCAVSLTGTNAGDLIVVGLFVLDSTSVSSVTDTQGNHLHPHRLTADVVATQFRGEALLRQEYQGRCGHDDGDPERQQVHGSASLRLFWSRYFVAFGRQRHATVRALP